jgi:hypothetical protein
MAGDRKRLPKRTCPSLYSGRGEQELDVEEQAGREEEPAWTEELARSRRLWQRRLEFVTRTTTMTGDGDGGCGGGSGGGGGGDDDEDHDAGCGGGGHDDDECHGALGFEKVLRARALNAPYPKATPPPAQGDCARRERVSKLLFSYCSHSMLKTELQTNNYC